MCALAASAGNRERACLRVHRGLYETYMGYIYSLVLLVAIVCRAGGRGAKIDHWIRELAPAVVTGSALIAVLGIIYGPVALVRTAIPIEGMSNYRAANFGFFTGSGREFWNPDGVHWLFYLFDFSGFWIVGTLFLICSGVAAIFYLATGAGDGELEAHRNEIIATCAVLHVAFITLFFGNQWSWIYYAYFLTVGVAAAAGASAIQRRVTIGLCVMGTMAWIACDSGGTAVLGYEPARRVDGGAVGVERRTRGVEAGARFDPRQQGGDARFKGSGGTDVSGV